MFEVLLVSLLVIILLVALQIWLCKKSLRLGLILPCISLAMSLLLTVILGCIWLYYKGHRDTLTT